MAVDGRIPVLINRNYARLWTSGAVSMLGDAIFDTTLILWIATVVARNASWAPLAVVGVLLAVAVPAFVIAPVAGVFVDRWDFRRTMIVNDAIRAVLIGAMAVLPMLSRDLLPVAAQLTIIYVVVFLTSISSQFFNPARFAVTGDLVTAEERPKASSVNTATYAIAGIIGPPLAAPLLFTIGVQWSLLFNAASFVVSLLLVRSIRITPELTRTDPPESSASVWSDFLVGLRFFLSRRILVALLVSAMVVMAGAGSLNVLDVFFVHQNLHAAPKFFGVLGMAFSIGTVVGALAASTVIGRIGLIRTYWVGLMLTAATLVGYARTTNVVLAIIVLAVGAVPIGALNSAVGPIVLQAVPRELVGRAITVLNPAIQLATIVSVTVSGWLASSVLRDLDTTVAGIRIGPIDTIYTVAGILTLGAAVYAMVAMREPVPEPAPEPAPVPEPTA